MKLGAGSDENNNSSLEQEVIKQRLHEVRLTFNCIIFLALTSAAVSIVGIGCLFSGKISEGIATTTGGMAGKIVSAHLLKLNKEANDRLEEMIKEFEE